jgi:very-short-patch-repair endonuclease/predicted DNA-binding transcriptional regulator AlpA
MNEALKLLQDAVGYTEKEIPDRFIITEQNGEWVIKAYRYLDGPTFSKILRAISDKGGGYRKDETTKFAIFTLPKQQKEKEEPKEPLAPIEEQGEYALSKSLKGKLGQLVPCLQDAEGIIIDGFHRLKVNPKAWTVKNDQIKTPVDRALARMTVNFCRRHYSSEEMKNDIGLLIGSGLTVEQIAEITGIGKSTIYNYMPPEKKDKVLSEAQKKGWEEKNEFPRVETPLKTQETIIPKANSGQIYKTYLLGMRPCEKCGKQTERTKMHFVDNLLICPECAGKDKPLPVRKLELEPTFKPQETWQQRKAVMQPQHSKMEEKLLLRLSGKGFTPETDIEFCLQKTTPDFYFRKQNLAIYIDGPVHQGREDKDDMIREQLTKQGVHVVSLPYETDKDEDKLFEQILEVLKW